MNLSHNLGKVLYKNNEYDYANGVKILHSTETPLELQERHTAERSRLEMLFGEGELNCRGGGLI